MEEWEAMPGSTSAQGPQWFFLEDVPLLPPFLQLEQLLRVHAFPTAIFAPSKPSALGILTQLWLCFVLDGMGHLTCVPVFREDQCTYMNLNSDSLLTKTSRSRWILAISSSISSGIMVVSAMEMMSS